MSTTSKLSKALHPGLPPTQSTASPRLQTRDVTLNIPPTELPGLHGPWHQRLFAPLESRKPQRPPALGDCDVQERCRQTLQWLTTLPEENIHIAVDEAWVTLTGVVHDNVECRTAEEILSKVPGVAGVQNDLRIE
jgi:hypothetical protein